MIPSVKTMEEMKQAILGMSPQEREEWDRMPDTVSGPSRRRLDPWNDMDVPMIQHLLENGKNPMVMVTSELMSISMPFLRT